MVVYTGPDCKSYLAHGDDVRKSSQIAYLTQYVVGSIAGLMVIILSAVTIYLSLKTNFDLIDAHHYLETGVNKSSEAETDFRSLLWMIINYSFVYPFDLALSVISS